MAQEREKRRIVIASILKPVDDTRMFGKMGQSLDRSKLFEVSIIGYAPAEEMPTGTIRFFSLGAFPRIGIQRWLARWRVWSMAAPVRPDVFIFTTHELIPAAILLKVIFGTRIIYDVRENYYRNIRFSESLPWWMRLPLAAMVRLKEKLTAPAIDHFFLAERGYEREFKFHRGGWTVIENKALSYPAAPPKRIAGGLNLLFTGTLAESTGVFRAIELTRVLHQQNPLVQLTIAGYAASRHVQQRLRKEVTGLSYIKVIGVETLVPHEVIANLILESNAGIIAYPASQTTMHAIPTKLFEYLAGSLPILLEERWPWIERYASCRPFITIDFGQPDAKAILESLATSSFYTSRPPDAGWDTEEPRLLDAVRNIV